MSGETYDFASVRFGARLGYTLGTGRLFTDFAAFQQFAEWLADEPILTHEFADEATWLNLRDAFETLTEFEIGEEHAREEVA